MKKIVSIFVGLVALIAAGVNAYLLFFKSDQPAGTTTRPAEGVQPSVEETSSSSSSLAAQEAAKYTDGTYTGAVTSTNRGDYQVQVTVSGGQMTDIAILQFPDDNDMSLEINDNALPIYTAEALENQSADINQVSGASEAFKGFTGSLQDALNQAS